MTIQTPVSDQCVPVERYCHTVCHLPEVCTIRLLPIYAHHVVVIAVQIKEKCSKLILLFSSAAAVSLLPCVNAIIAAVIAATVSCIQKSAGVTVRGIITAAPFLGVTAAAALIAAVTSSIVHSISSVSLTVRVNVMLAYR
jgi:hypothetical protein